MSDLSESVSDKMPDLSRIPEPTQWLAPQKVVRHAIYADAPTTKVREIVNAAMVEQFNQSGGGLFSPPGSERNNGRVARWILQRGHYAHREFKMIVEVEPQTMIRTKQLETGEVSQKVYMSRVTVTAAAKDHRLSDKEKAVLSGEFITRINATATGRDFRQRDIALVLHQQPVGEGLS